MWQQEICSNCEGMHPFNQNLLFLHSLESFELVCAYNHLKWGISSIGGHHGCISRVGHQPTSWYIEFPMGRVAWSFENAPNYMKGCLRFLDHKWPWQVQLVFDPYFYVVHFLFIFHFSFLEWLGITPTACYHVVGMRDEILPSTWYGVPVDLIVCV